MLIPERQAQLDSLLSKHFPNEVKQPEANGSRQRRHVDLHDDEIIAKLRKAKNSAKFQQLFDHGVTNGYDHDDSRADLALLSMLAFYSHDPEQLDRLFRRSALCREKWLKRSDYRRRTIDAALDGLRETYRASSSSPPHRGDEEDDGKTTLAVKSFRSLPKSGKPRQFRV